MNWGLLVATGLSLMFWLVVLAASLAVTGIGGS